MTEKYEYCSTVPRTFVQDCRSLDFTVCQDELETLKNLPLSYFSINLSNKPIFQDSVKIFILNKSSMFFLQEGK